MHRIPHGKNGSDNNGEPRPVVFIQHGLLCSSADWVLSDPPKALGNGNLRYPQGPLYELYDNHWIRNIIFTFLAFIMSDAGYDVWLGNYRGNTYSRRHEHLDPDEYDYWRFR